MKKLSSILLSTLLLFSTVSCTLGGDNEESEEQEESSEHGGGNHPGGDKPGEGGGDKPGGESGGGSSSSTVTYSAANSITTSTTLTTGSYSSTTTDENSLSVSGEITASLSNISITKSGDSDGGDNTSFYGINSAFIAKEGAVVTLDNINVSSEAVGGNGVFCYGGYAKTNNTSTDGTTVNISNSTITTSKDNSGGIMTTGGGSTNATNLTITTEGTSSAAIRTDRGGGNVIVNRGTYTTNGKGSPAIYSTAYISVFNASLISNHSEGIVVEGNNSVVIDNCNLTDTNDSLNGKSTTYKNIFLYQSVSGDAGDSASSFTSTNSTITTNKGDSFYVTNNDAIINLTNNTIINNDTDSYFLRAQADSWGSSGSNGGRVSLYATNQNINGNIYIDSVSTLEFVLSYSSYYEGCINKDNTANNISLTLDESSSIKLTGNSYISSLDNKDLSNSNIDFNGYKLYVNGTAIN